MKKIILIFLSFISSSILISAQSWEPLGSGMNSWVGGFTVYNGNLIAGGGFDSAGGKPANHIAEWNGTSWSSLGSGLNMPGVPIAFYNGELIAGGQFTTAGGNPANNIAMWNGTSWSTLGSGMNGSTSSAIVYKGNLIVGGNFTTAGGNPASNIAEWNGTSWSALGSGVNNICNCPETGVFALDTFQNNLIVGGAFDTAGGQPANYIAEWNGTSWSALGSGLRHFSLNYVDALTVYNGELIVGGGFDTAGGIPANRIAAWNGTSWSALGTGLSNDVFALTVYNGNLIAGGQFYIPYHRIAQWNGILWSSFGNSINGANIGCLDIFNGNLIAGGDFDSAGGYRVNYITEWCDTCKPLGVNELRPANSGNELRIFPNPNNGIFQIGISNEQLIIKSTVEIYNMLGERVYSKQFSTFNFQLSIDLSDQPAGIYLYRVINQTENRIGAGKFIIE
jgi:hypothetical protein